MRLLNTQTLQFETYNDSPSSIPYYAILSHRWTDHETSYKHFRKTLDPTTHLRCKKVTEFCAFARARGMEYAWIDSCCIDVRSSAELSEAINSMYGCGPDSMIMFHWYRRARVCYVYMADVGIASPETDEQVESAVLELRYQELRNSSWFSRGWTLQELLAPHRVEFCTRDWQVFGTKADEPFVQILHEITGIPMPALRDPRLVTEFSIAQRMSWAAHRRTTRIEDQAYCLLGLFQVNMALLYGEGTRAFQRLQREILAQDDDESIFAWTIDRFMAQDGLGVLADSPRSFAGSGDIVRTYRSRQPPCVMTSKGLSFTPRISFYHDHLSEAVWIIYLECGRLKPSNHRSGARTTGMFQRREVQLCAIALARDHQASIVSQQEWREAVEASKRVVGLDPSLLLARRAKFQPSFYRVLGNTLSREDMTESLPRGKGTLELDRSFYMKV